MLFKPGVMDPVVAECAGGGGGFGDSARGVCDRAQVLVERRELDSEIKSLGERLLANDAIEQVYFWPLSLEQLELGRPYRFELPHDRRSRIWMMRHSCG